jgi:hypothetical protein
MPRLSALVRRALAKRSGRLYFAFALLGALVGCTLLLLAIQLGCDARRALKEQSALLGGDYVILAKKVTALGTLTGAKGGFSDAELADLRGQPFVRAAAGVTGSRFPVALGLTKIGLCSEIFFESMPDAFLDVQPKDWQWQPGSPHVPVVISKDFIDLYNFGFAAARGLPRLPRSATKLVDLDLAIPSPSGIFTTKARVVGFSDRINSVLVPAAFMDWANKKYGVTDYSLPSRVIVRTNNPEDARLAGYLQAKNLETNTEKLRGGRLRTILSLSLAATASVGVVIVLLAAFVLVLYFQIVIVRADSEITLLSHLGVPQWTIIRAYLVQAAAAIVLVALVSLAVVFWLKARLAAVAEAEGLPLPSGISPETCWAGAAVLLGLLLFNAAAIIRGVRRLA